MSTIIGTMLCAWLLAGAPYDDVDDMWRNVVLYPIIGSSFVDHYMHQNVTRFWARAPHDYHLDFREFEYSFV